MTNEELAKLQEKYNSEGKVKITTAKMISHGGSYRVSCTASVSFDDTLIMSIISTYRNNISATTTIFSVNAYVEKQLKFNGNMFELSPSEFDTCVHGTGDFGITIEEFIERTIVLANSIQQFLDDTLAILQNYNILLGSLHSIGLDILLNLTYLDKTNFLTDTLTLTQSLFIQAKNGYLSELQQKLILSICRTLKHRMQLNSDENTEVYDAQPVAMDKSFTVRITRTIKS